MTMLELKITLNELEILFTWLVKKTIPTPKETQPRIEFLKQEIEKL